MNTDAQDPPLPEVDSAMGFYALGMVDEAIEELNRLPAPLRKAEAVLKAKAMVYMEADRWQDSLLCWRLFQRHDQTGTNLYSASLCLFHLGRYDEAREVMLLAMPEARSHQDAWWNLACIEVGRGRLKAAEQAARMAVQCDPEVLGRLLADSDLKPIHPFLETLHQSKEPAETNAPVVWSGDLLSSAALVWAVKRVEAADEDWGACMAFPQEYQVFLDWARGYADFGMFKDAEAELYRVPYHFRSSVKFIRHLAYVFCSAKRWSEAIPLYMQLRRLVPHAISPRDNLAKCLSSIGLFKNALAVLEKSPRHPILEARKEEIQKTWAASRGAP